VSAEARGARFGGRLFGAEGRTHGQPSSLTVEVDDWYIVITMPGTTFRASYFVSFNSPELTRSDWMIEDGDANVSRTDFLELAVKAAHAKARELGWLVERLHE
jgi:hypothetical protein